MSSNETATASKRTFVTMLVWPRPGGIEALARFRERAKPLLDRYDLRIERVLDGRGKGQLVGENPWDVPPVIQILSVPSVESFRAYVGDPEYRTLAAERDANMDRIVAVIGEAIPPAEDRPRSVSALEGRLYGVAFATFKPGGADGLLEFNRRAQALFVRHGMHVEQLLSVSAVVTPVGAPLAGFAPERVIVFFLDDGTSLPAYASDPEYRELAPLRDRGLERYDFFTARAPRPDAASAES